MSMSLLHCVVTEILLMKLKRILWLNNRLTSAECLFKSY